MISKHGHLWQVSRNGWENGDLDWVKVEKESVGTAFHAYQVLTGGLTHKPEWTGPKTRNGEGEKTMSGRTLNLKTLDKRLHDVHLLMKDVVEKTVKDENGEDVSFLTRMPSSEEVMKITVA